MPRSREGTLISRVIPTLILFFALVFFGFLGGLAAYHYNWPAYRVIFDAKKTAQAIYLYAFPPTQAVLSGNVRDLSRMRVRTLVPNSYNDNFILAGGFHDQCPQYGCLAVTLSRTGQVLRKVPYRPDLLLGRQIAALPYETMFFDIGRDTGLSSVLTLPGGDWLASIAITANAHPYGGGLARMKPNGEVIWFRADYSHHWASLTIEGEIVTPAMILTKEPINVTIAGQSVGTLTCHTTMSRDVVNVLSTDGQVKEETPIVEALMNSPFKAHILHTIEPCDPTHVNFTRSVGVSLAAALGPDVAPDDLLISMRHLSAFGVLSRKTKSFVRFFRGSFAFQHSVQPVGGTRVILVDNLGGAGLSGSTRVLIMDLATGKETVLFPLPSLPADQRVFTARAGMIDVSPDGSRVLVAFTDANKAYEIRLSDGAILTEINGVDVSDKPGGRLVATGLSVVRYEHSGGK